MKKISGSNVYFKKVFPFLWFGFLAFFFVTSLESGAGCNSVMFYIIPIFLTVFGYFLFKRLVWDLVDEVYDLGDELLFRKGGTEQHVKLRDIVNIDCAPMNSPERITVNVRHEGPLGKELVFNPPMRMFTFTRNPLIKELIERVDRARNT